MLNYPLDLFHAKSNLKRVKKTYEKLVKEFLEKIDEKIKLSIIEDSLKISLNY